MSGAQFLQDANARGANILKVAGREDSHIGLQVLKTDLKEAIESLGTAVNSEVDASTLEATKEAQLAALTNLN